MIFSPERQQQVRRSILEFLERQAVVSAIHPMCTHCGRAMTVTPLTFSLCGTDLTRTVRLFVCDCQIKNGRQKTARVFRQRCSVNEEENSQLKDLSQRIANEQDPEKLVALAKELEQWAVKRRTGVERRKMTLTDPS